MVDKKTEQELKRIWCKRLLISMGIPILIGFSFVKVQPILNYSTQLDAYKQKLDIELYQEYKVVSMLEHEKAGKEDFILVRKVEYKTFIAGDIGITEERVLESNLITKQQYKQISKLQKSRKKVHEKYLLELFVVLGLASGGIGMLVLLLRQRNQVSLSLTGQLICFLPEECIAELEALYQQMKSKQRSIWLIRMIMLRIFLELLWAFYIQINFDNLRSPQNNGRKKN